MSSIHDALQDINWLSQRLKGVMTLSEEIQDYDRMKDQSVDLDKIISQKKEKVNSLEAQAKELETKIEEFISHKENSNKALKTELDGLLAKAHLGANEVMAKAKEDAAAIRSAVEQERQAYLLKNKGLEDISSSLSKDVNAKKQQLTELNASISQLKAKF